MPCQMERMLCVMLGTCRMVAFDYLDTHTYPIIPAVKKSPSDIFVVFCLRSERLKYLDQIFLRNMLVETMVKCILWQDINDLLRLEGSEHRSVFPKMWLYCLSGMLLTCYGMGLGRKKVYLCRQLHSNILLMSINWYYKSSKHLKGLLQIDSTYLKYIIIKISKSEND